LKLLPGADQIAYKVIDCALALRVRGSINISSPDGSCSHYNVSRPIVENAVLAENSHLTKHVGFRENRDCETPTGKLGRNRITQRGS
jgi:hypothetical protein